MHSTITKQAPSFQSKNLTQVAVAALIPKLLSTLSNIHTKYLVVLYQKAPLELHIDFYPGVLIQEKY